MGCCPIKRRGSGWNNGVDSGTGGHASVLVVMGWPRRREVTAEWEMDSKLGSLAWEVTI